MRPRPLPGAVRRLAALALAALACAPLASAAPTADALRSQRDALDARDATLGSELSRAERALVAGRARLDRARLDQRAALDGLRSRLRAIYAAPEPSPLVELLTGGDLESARAGLDLLQMVGARDMELVRRYRSSTAARDAAEASLQRRKDRLVAARRSLGVERELVSGRLGAAVRAERALAADDSAAAAPVLTTGAGALAVSGLGLPAAAAPADVPATAVGATRGLPASFLAGRALPGAAPVDAQSGDVVDGEPIAATPGATRALPGIGAVGPGAGTPLTGRLPTFTAVASWYGPDYTGTLATGDPYDPNAFSAASRTLRLGTLLRVAYGGRVVTVRVNDRGPYVRGRDLELSQAAAAALGLPGVGQVTAQILPAYSGPPARG